MNLSFVECLAATSVCVRFLFKTTEQVQHSGCAFESIFIFQAILFLKT